MIIHVTWDAGVFIPWGHTRFKRAEKVRDLSAMFIQNFGPCWGLGK